MKFLKWFFKNLIMLIGVVIVLALANRRYLGGFISPEAKEQNMGPYTIAYTNFIGEYSKVWPSMTKVYEILSGAGIVSSTGIGIYYDDPAVVSWAELRSDVWAVIDAKDASKIANNTGVKVKIIPGGNKIVVEFPFKNMFSSMIGPMKVYPVMTKYIEQKWYSHEVVMIELYDMAAKKIYYMAEIVK